MKIYLNCTDIWRYEKDFRKYREIYTEKLEIQKETTDKNIYNLILEYCPNDTLKSSFERHVELNNDSKTPI